MRLQSKVAIITGGASGIGYAAARRFKEEGAIVIIADYNEVLITTVASNLQVDAYPLDVRDVENCHRLAQFVIEKYGKIDIVVNNAGITKDNMLHKMNEDDFDEVLDVNCKGVFHVTKAVVPFMREAGYGKIINTASIVGVHGNVGQTNYAASKAAVIGMTKTWAKELGKKGINVNAVAPGFIETDMVKSIPAQQLMMMKMIISLGSLGQAEDVANSYVFLASEESKYITGQVLHVDGGMMG